MSINNKHLKTQQKKTYYFKLFYYTAIDPIPFKEIQDLKK